MPLTVPRLLTLTTVPLICEGILSIVGFAFGTAWSMVNFFLPVTMSRASSRPAALPMTVYCDADFGTTLVGSGNRDAATVSEA